MDPFSEAAPLTLSSEENVLYTSLFKVLDMEKTGTIGMNAAASFLTRSKLPQTVLREIWDLSDSERKGSLDKNSFFKALKLVALAQASKPVSISSLGLKTGLPVFEGLTDSIKINQPSVPKRSPSFSADAISNEEKERFKAAFAQCSPVDGFADSGKARAMFLKSGLSAEILAQVWTLVDKQATAKLNQQQFCVAMYMISKIKSNQLTPPFSIPESVFKFFEEAEEIPAISAAQKSQSFVYFDQLDVDRKGFVTGKESFDFFIKSSLPTSTLAGIWNMVDTNKSGKLDREQFAQAMHLIRLAKSGRQLPLESLSMPATPVVQSKPLIPDLLDLDNPPVLMNRQPSVKEQQPEYTELSKKKQEVSDLQTQIKILQPASDELRQRRMAVEQELKSVSEERNQLMLKHSQLRATFEAESQIVKDLESTLSRDVQFYEALKQELEQFQLQLQKMAIEKQNLHDQIAKFKNDSADIQAQLTGYRESTNQLSKQLERLRLESGNLEKSFTTQQQQLASAQSEYQTLRKELESEERSVHSASPFKESPLRPKSAASMSSMHSLKSVGSKKDDFQLDPFAVDPSPKISTEFSETPLKLSQTTDSAPPPLPPSSTKPKPQTSFNPFSVIAKDDPFAIDSSSKTTEAVDLTFDDVFGPSKHDIAPLATVAPSVATPATTLSIATSGAATTDSKELEQLVSMGFSREKSLQALEKTNNNVTEATQLLLE